MHALPVYGLCQSPPHPCALLELWDAASTEVMETMWNNFNEIAEGFGLNVNEFIKIVDIEGLKATAQDARAVFQAFDTDSVRLLRLRRWDSCGAAFSPPLVLAERFGGCPRVLDYLCPHFGAVVRGEDPLCVLAVARDAAAEHTLTLGATPVQTRSAATILMRAAR